MSKETILFAIITIFLLLGVFLPFINSAFGFNSNTIDTGTLVEDIEQEGVSGLTIALSVLGIFTWTFGALNPIIDVFLVIPRVMLAIITFQLIRGS